ncbi:MAG: hypothetical protein AAGA96_03915 [Verrucomicrobiota bacterium]
MKTIQFMTLIVACGLAIAATTEAADRSEDDLLAVLSSTDSSLEEKAMACDDLGRVGTAKAVPVLAELLSNQELHDYARDGLERIPDGEAGQALMTALDTLEGSLRVGVVITLGDRAEEAAVPALSEIAGSSDGVAAGAALVSLGLIASDKACATIISALVESEGKVQESAARAALIALQRRSKAGQASEELTDALDAAEIPERFKTVAK